ncbi:MAG: S1/P1 nuclease [Pseudomonadales bacterium]
MVTERFKHTAFVRVFFTLLMLGLLPSGAQAWSDTGHRLTCDLAFTQLKPEARETLRAWMRAMPSEHAETFLSRSQPEVSDLCVWADKVRKDKTYDRVASWHYVNVDRTATEIDRAACVTGCILTAIRTHLDLIQETGLSEWPKLQALMFLMHWVGDIHQPMHVSFADDLGGNRAKVLGYEDCNNMHGVWDYCLVKETGQGYAALLDRLKLATPEPFGNETLDPDVWANESLTIARHPRTQYCRLEGGRCEPWASRQYQLADDYQQMNWPIAAARIQQAGGRLAALLNHVLVPAS